MLDDIMTTCATGAWMMCYLLHGRPGLPCSLRQNDNPSSAPSYQPAQTMAAEVRNHCSNAALPFVPPISTRSSLENWITFTAANKAKTMEMRSSCQPLLDALRGKCSKIYKTRHRACEVQSIAAAISEGVQANKEGIVLP